MPLIQTDPLLRKEHRSGRSQFDKNGHDQKQGQTNDEQNQRAGDIKNALQKKLPTFNTAAAGYNLGSAGRGLGPRVSEFQIEDIRVKTHEDAVLLGEFGHLGSALVEGAKRKEDCNLIDYVSPEE